MKKHSAVIVSLHNPKEKFWGLLLCLDTCGVTVRGIDLESFDDWTREAARGGASMGLSTVFFPLHRVEKIILDERVGDIPALSNAFESRVGHDVWSFLELPSPEV